MIGEMKFFLGLQIVQNNDGIFISQAKYLKDFLMRFELESCKLVGTPMITDHKLSSKDETHTIEQKNYKSMIGGLQYLTHTRLDIENAPVVEHFPQWKTGFLAQQETRLYFTEYN